MHLERWTLILPYHRSSLKYLIKAAASDSRFDPACNKKRTKLVRKLSVLWFLDHAEVNGLSKESVFLTL